MSDTDLPPIPIDQVHEDLLQAFRDLEWSEAKEILIRLGELAPRHLAAHVGLEHALPSPSGVTGCARQMWFKAHGVKADRALPESWLSRAVVGILTETFWATMLERSNPLLRYEPFLDPIDIGPVFGWPDGKFPEIEHSLVEFKSMTGWAFMYVMDKGVEAEEPAHDAQIQLYMDGAHAKWCLYLTASADPSFLQNIIRKFRKKPDLELPFFYVEWLHHQPAKVKLLHDRLTYLTVAVHAEKPAPCQWLGADGARLQVRNLDPEVDMWPCINGCGWRATCRGMRSVER